MKSKLKFALLLTLIVFTVSAKIAGATGALMDISEAIDLTLKNNSTLRSLKQEINKAEAFKLRADGAFLPSLNANANITRQKESIFIPEGPELNESKSAIGTLEQTLYSGGKNTAMKKQSTQKKTIAEMIIIGGENRAIGELFARFYNVLLQKEYIKAEESAVKTSRAHHNRAKNMNKLGLLNKLDVIRAEQQLATNSANLSKAKGNYEAAEISLMNYMGIEPQDRRAITGALTMRNVSGNKNESLQLATEFRADLKQLQEQLKFQNNQILIEKSGLLPKLTLAGSGGWNHPNSRKDVTGSTWMTQLSVSVPIFDRSITRSNLMTAKASLEQDKIALEQKELDIKSEVETAWTSIETAAFNVNATEKALELAEESLRLAQVGYEEGVTPQIDLLAAQTGLTSAMLSYANAKYNHLMAVVALKMTEGTIVKWSGEIKINEQYN